MLIGVVFYWGSGYLSVLETIYFSKFAITYLSIISLR